jgi:hypothetical protein
MNCLRYNDYNIIAAGKRDEITGGKYKPTIHIAWRSHDGKRQSHSFSLPELCATFEQASDLALKAAKAWADHRLSDSRAMSHTAVSQIQELRTMLKRS